MQLPLSIGLDAGQGPAARVLSNYCLMQFRLLARLGLRRLARARPLCPGISDIHLLSNRQGVVDLDPEITDRALDLRMTK
jgi:hypothetical protein